MRAFVRRWPTLSLLVVSLALGLTPIALVAAGVLSPGFNQLGALSASAAGFVLAAFLGGREGVRQLFRRALGWRVGIGWWAFVLLFPGLMTVAALWIGSRTGGPAFDLGPAGSPVKLVGLILFLVVFAGLGEEFGWRGFALPRVQVRRGALVASLMVAVAHAIWHTPLFFIEGVSQNDIARQAGFWPAYLGHALMVLALGVQIAWVFNQTGGSVLLAAVYHGSLNGWNGYIDIYRGQLGGVVAYVGVLVVVAAAMAIVSGPAHLSRARPRAVEDVEAELAV
jgi:membrane protease YdiL (CAAX protease family)